MDNTSKEKRESFLENQYIVLKQFIKTAGELATYPKEEISNLKLAKDILDLLIEELEEDDFRTWKDDVDEILLSKFGCKSDEMKDYIYLDSYYGGSTPQECVKDMFNVIKYTN